MAVKGDFKFSNPDAIEVTLVLTMSVREWKIIKSRLKPQEDNAEWDIDLLIERVLEKADREFHIYQNIEKSDANNG